MKKIFRLSAIVAMLSMMATATVATSCSDDDDDSTEVVEEDWTSATTKITATPGATIKAKNANNTYSVKVVSAKEGEVVVSMNGNNVTLSDAGTSYLSVSGTGLYKAEAEANASDVLLALSAGTTTLVSGTEVKDEIIANGANKTLLK